MLSVRLLRLLLPGAGQAVPVHHRHVQGTARVGWGALLPLAGVILKPFQDFLSLCAIFHRFRKQKRSEPRKGRSLPTVPARSAPGCDLPWLFVGAGIQGIPQPPRASAGTVLLSLKTCAGCCWRSLPAPASPCLHAEGLQGSQGCQAAGGLLSAHQTTGRCLGAGGLCWLSQGWHQRQAERSTGDLQGRAPFFLHLSSFANAAGACASPPLRPVRPGLLGLGSQDNFEACPGCELANRQCFPQAWSCTAEASL